MIRRESWIGPEVICTTCAKFSGEETEASEEENNSQE